MFKILSVSFTRWESSYLLGGNEARDVECVEGVLEVCSAKEWVDVTGTIITCWMSTLCLSDRVTMLQSGLSDD